MHFGVGLVSAGRWNLIAQLLEMRVKVKSNNAGGARRRAAMARIEEDDGLSRIIPFDAVFLARGW
jgi:hypothetical protein